MDGSSSHRANGIPTEHSTLGGGAALEVKSPPEVAGAPGLRFLELLREGRERGVAEAVSGLLAELGAVGYVCELGVDPVRWYGAVGALIDDRGGATCAAPEDWLARIHGDDAARVEREHERALEVGGYETRYRFRRADGSWAWILDRAAVERGPDGRAATLVGLMLDVSAQRGAMEEARAATEAHGALRRRHESLLGALGKAVYDHDLLADRYEWSGACEDVFGVPAERVPRDGRSFLERVHPDDEARGWSALRRAAEAGAPVTLRYRYTDFAGRVRWLDDRALATADDAGRIVRLTGTVTDVTERVASERERELLFELAADILLVTTPDGVIRQVNRAGLRLLGYSEEELIGRDTRALMHPDDAGESAVHVARVCAGDAPEPLLNRYRTRAGEWRWISWTGRYDAERGLLCGAGRDVTAQREAEEQRAALAARQASLIAAAGQIVVDFDARLGTLEWSGAVREMLGREPAEMPRTVEGARGLYWPGDFEACWAEMERARGEGRDRTASRARMRHADGSWRWVQKRGVVVRGADGTMLRQVATFADVTREVAAEAEADAFFQMGADAFVIVGFDGVVRRINDAGLALLGYARGEVVGREFFGLVGEEERAGVRDLHARIAGGAPTVAGCVQRWVAKDGSSRWLEWSCTADRVAGVMLKVGRDLTARREAERALAEASTRQADVLRAVGAWAYEVDLGADGVRVARVSGAIDRVLGAGVERVTTAEWQSRLHPEDVGELTRAFEASVATGAPMEVQYRVRDARGEWMWVRDRGLLRRGREGAPDRWVGVTVDVTAQRRAEEHAERLRARVDVALRDIGCQTYDVDHAAGTAVVLGGSAPFWGADFGGVAPDGEWLKKVHPEDLPRLGEALERHEREGVPLHVEYRVRDVEGRWRRVQDHAQVRRDGQGRRVGMAGVVIDVTALREAEERAEALLRRMGETLEAVGGWAYEFDERSQRADVRGAIAPFLGAGATDTTHEGWAALVHPEDRAAVARIPAAARGEPGATVEVEYRVRNLAGEYRWVRDRGVLTPGRSGGPPVWMGVTIDVTDLRAARERAEELARRQAEVLHALGVWTYEVDVESGASVVQGAFEAFASPEGGAPTMDAWRARVHPDDLALMQETWERGMRGEVPTEVEYRVRSNSGLYRWVRGWSTIRSDGAGRPRSWVGVSIDVTARREAQEWAEQLSRLHESTVEAIGGVVYDYDAREDRLRWSGAVEAVFGRAGLGARTLDDWLGTLHPEDREAARAADAAVRVLGEFDMMYRVRRDDGGWRWVYDRGVVRTDEAGVAGVVGVCTDVTARRQAEDQARSFFEHAGDMMLVMDAGGLIVRANPAFLRFAGLTPGQEAGVSGVDLTHPDERAEAAERTRAMASAGRASTLTARMRAADGSYRWTQWTVAFDGTSGLYCCAGRDVTDAREAEERQRLLARELDHRVKNTLAAVSAVADLTLDATPEPGAFRDAFQGRLRAMSAAHALLSGSRWRGTDLGGLLRAVLRPYAGGAPDDAGGGARAVVDGPPVTLPAPCVQPLALALHELATNAAKHGALRGRDGTLRVRWGMSEAGASEAGATETGARESAPGERRLCLRWDEVRPLAERTGATSRTDAEESGGRGLRLVERLVRYELRGDVRWRVSDEGARVEIDVPLGSPGAALSAASGASQGASPAPTPQRAGGGAP